MDALQMKPGTRDSRILDSLNTAVLVFDRRLRLSYLNPAGEILFGVSARHAQGQTLAELVPAAESLGERLRWALDADHPYTEHELRLRLASGEEITVDCVVTPLLDQLGGGDVLIELTQVDRHLRIAREENILEQHQAARQLVRGLAHEIKNPLGGLRGAAQLLERQLDDDELREYTRIIIGEADRLRALVNRMLGPNQRPQARPCNIHQIVEHVRNLVAAEDHEDLTLIRDYDPSIPDFIADPEQLIQALLNIVRNAAEALQGKGRIILRTRTQRQFTIGQKRHKLVVRVDVIDDGPGIPPEMLETIFYPMVTGRAEGTGLGLSIAQSLVNVHGGLIECASRPGETRFTILLPLEQLHDQGR